MAKRLVLNTDWCYGCFSCEVACKQENNIPVGPRLIRVLKQGPEEINGKLSMTFKLQACRQCEDPACMEACAFDAISVRDDGIVLFDESKCTFCGECKEVCPYDVPQENHEQQVMQKCHLCFARLDQGLEPACVKHCPTGALTVLEEA